MQATKVVLGGDDQYYFENTVGFHFNASADSLASFGVMYELMMKNMYSMYSHQKWFEWIQKRIEYEKGNITHQNSGMTFWPKLTEKCTSDSFQYISTNCFTGLYDLRTKPSIVVNDKQYFLDDNEQLIHDWPLRSYSLKYFTAFQDDEILKLKNPQIPVVLVYSKSNRTIGQTIYDGKITDYTEKGQFPKNHNIMIPGDGTVSPNSALIPALKWAYQYQHKEDYPDQGDTFKVF
jgi:hypothetical protein